MKKPTKSEITEALKTPYFEAVLDYLKASGNPEDKVLAILNTPYEDLDSPPLNPQRGEALEQPSQQQRDVFYAWHKYRVLEVEGVKAILPKNVETHTLVTALGHVCIIRKPVGRVLGKVMSKVGAFTKEPDYYQAGSVILRECKIYMEKPIETNPDELFSLKIACLGATTLMETRIKKN